MCGFLLLMITKLARKLIAARLILAVILMVTFPAQTHAALIDVDAIGSWLKGKITPIAWANQAPDKTDTGLVTVKGVALIPANHPLVGVSRVYETFVTAYSSSVDETDSTPFITASGEKVRDGIVAANFLPFGAKIKIPEIFGNKIFVVKDRMASRHAEKVDIWFESKTLAKQFGRQKLQIQVLEKSI